MSDKKKKHKMLNLLSVLKNVQVLEVFFLHGTPINPLIQLTCSSTDSPHRQQAKYQ